MEINKGQFRLTTRRKNFKFELKRGKGHLLNYLSNRIKWHYFPRLHHISKFPSHVDVELSSLCDLNCPMCYTTTDEYKNNVKRSLMDFDLFKKIVDESAKYNLYSIRLSLRGESFLHPKILEMIEYAKNKGIKEVSTLTHGGRIDEEKFEKLVDLGLDWLTISFDGVGETYEKIRHPLKYDDMIKKIAKFKEIKKQKKSVKPVIKVQTIWPAISNNPKEFYDTFNNITDQIASNPLIDYLHNDDEILFEDNFTCPQLWQRLTIGADGRVMLCANDEMMTNQVGDVNNELIYDIWHGEKLQKAREIHLKHNGAKELDPCKHCYLPRKTKTMSVKLENRLLKIDNYVNREQTVGK